jgi:hypothetical protein
MSDASDDVLGRIVIHFDEFSTFDNFGYVCRRFYDYIQKNKDKFYKLHAVYYDDEFCESITVFGLDHSVDDRPLYCCEWHSEYRWYYRGLLHRENDLPAAIYGAGGTDYFNCDYNSGQTRDYDEDLIDADGDPELDTDGAQEWYYRGHIWRAEGKPTLTYTNGREEWWNDRRRHRADDLPAVIDRANHYRGWYRDGELYRSDYAYNSESDD